MIRRRALLVGILALGVGSEASAATGTGPICLLPLGRHDAAALEVAGRGITALWSAEVRVLPARDLPAEAWYAPRQRWRAERILDWIDRDVLPGSGCLGIVGFTSSDISTTKEPYEDWGIFGLGSMDGTSAVVSTFRLGRQGASRDLVLHRVVKVVNHEVGHTFGLPHCSTDTCLMEDAAGTIRTVDAETGAVCALCRAAVARLHPERPPVPDGFAWDPVLSPGRPAGDPP